MGGNHITLSEGGMVIDWVEISAIATVVYGAGTLLLVIQIWRDRVQRDRHFRKEVVHRKLDNLHSAFYDACGYWEGHKQRSGDSVVDASQAGRVFEALTRLECQLRLNDYKKEAHDLGLAVRSFSGVETQLGLVGVALGLFPPEYRSVRAVGFDSK
jgi:hypothetical protein